MIAFADPTLSEVYDLFEAFKELSGSSDTAGKLLLAYALLKRPGGVPTLSDIERSVRAMPATAEEGWITVAQAATRMNVTTKTVRELIRKGKIAGKKVGRVWRIDLESWQRWEREASGVALPADLPTFTHLQLDQPSARHPRVRLPGRKLPATACADEAA